MSFHEGQYLSNGPATVRNLDRPKVQLQLGILTDQKDLLQLGILTDQKDLLQLGILTDQKDLI